MAYSDHIKVDYWFAWKPVKTVNSGWVWLIPVIRTINSCDEAYLGLLPTYSYETIPK